jgi:hypothetical protein
MALREDILEGQGEVLKALNELRPLELDLCLELAKALDSDVVDEASLQVYYQGLNRRHNNPYKGAGIIAGTLVSILTAIAEFKFFYVSVFTSLSYACVHFAVQHYVLKDPLTVEEKEVYDIYSKMLATKADIGRYEALIDGSEESAGEYMARGPAAPAAISVKV